MTRFKKYYLSLTMSIVFVFMMIWNYTTPLFNDDEGVSNLNFNHIINDGINDYFHWNGRFIGQTIFRLLVNVPLGLESVLNAFMFVLFTYLILLICKIKKNERNVFNYLFILILIIGFTSDFAQIYIWRAGSGNYLWTMVFDLILIFLIKSDFSFNKNNYNIIYIVFLFILGFIVGETNENTVGGVLIMSVFYILFYKLKLRKYILPLFGIILGYATLLLSPGEWERAHFTNSYFLNLNLFEKIKYNFHGLLKGLYNNEKYIVLIFIIFFVLNLLFVKNKKKIIESIAWFVTSILMVLVLLISAGGALEPRTHFGTFVFMVIATLLLFNSDLNSNKIKIFNIFFVTFMGILTLFKLSEGLVDSYKTNVSINQRNLYIQKEKDRGRKIIYVHLLKYFGHTKYSITYDHSDFSKDSTYWVNNCTAIKFKVKQIRLK